MEQITLPLCIPYLKEQSISPQNYAQLSLSLFHRLQQNHFPDADNAMAQCYSLLRTVSSEPLPALEQISIVESGISCRKVQNLLGCRPICPACRYSSSYQNQNESDESLVIAYLLQDYSNFACMLSYHLKPSFFTALFYAKNDETFFSFPLHSSLYQYMLTNYHLGISKNQMLQNYMSSLKDELQEQLSSQNQTLVKTYINNLVQTGKSISLENATAAVQNIINARKAKRSSKTKVSPPASISATSTSANMNTLDFMLSADKFSIQKKPAEAPPKTLNNATAAPQPAGTSIQDNIKQTHARSTVPDINFKELGVFLTKQAEIPTIPETSVPVSIKPASSILSDFHISLNDFDGYSYFLMTADSSAQEYALFENSLLLSSFISLEGARDEEGCNYFLIYMEGTYFAFTPSCHKAVQLLAKILQHPGSHRKVLSFDGYYAAWLLAKEGVIPEHITCIQPAFRFLHQDAAAAYERTPEELITLLENRQNRFGLSFYCYAMKYYAHMYQQVSQIPEDKIQAYKVDQLFHLLLGISYYLPSAENQCSFNIDGTDSLTFTLPEYIPPSGYACIRFTIETNTPIKNLENLILRPTLAAICTSRLCLQSALQLICLKKEEFRVCFRNTYLEQVSESIHLLLSYFAQKEDVYIKVTEDIPS